MCTVGVETMSASHLLQFRGELVIHTRLVFVAHIEITNALVVLLFRPFLTCACTQHPPEHRQNVKIRTLDDILRQQTEVGTQ